MRLNLADPKVVTKPWGTESWEILSRDFCVKTIKLLRGHKTSFQWHRQKEEVNFIRSGEAEVWMEGDDGQIAKHHMREGDSFFVPATRKHRVIALTDLEMFEVSNEFVDDVVRIEDEFGRGDGRIEAEHLTPAVLILAAGLGSRLKQLTAHKNKALIPLADRAVISHVIEQFPKEYDLVVAVGYQRESLEEYCRLAHPERRFTFVPVDRWADAKTDPGYSAWCCREHLQRPFYLTAVDCLLDGPLPHMDGDWVGVYPTDCPEKYATVDVQGGLVTRVQSKGPFGFDRAFIGLASVWDYRTYWEKLGNAPENELLAPWRFPRPQMPIRAKQLKWYDAGNLDDLAVLRSRLQGETLGSAKTTEEVTYRVGNSVLKFHPNPDVTANRLERATRLGRLAPQGLNRGGTRFLRYDWVPGENLYQINDLAVYSRFVEELFRTIDSSVRWTAPQLVRSFYEQKTTDRVQAFRTRFGSSYLTEPLTINGRAYRSAETLLAAVDYASLAHHTLYSDWHGDLHFDNVICGPDDRFTYVDWRESFNGSTAGGDIYYDLGKLYMGSLFSLELLKDDATVRLSEGSSTILFDYPANQTLDSFRRTYERRIESAGYSLREVKLVAALALFNIAPLHSDVWGKTLWCKGVELLDGLI